MPHAPCPSTAWDCHVLDQEGPLECPVCGADNADPVTGDWLCPEAPGFCTTACRDSYVQAQGTAAAQLAADLAAEAADAAEADLDRCKSCTCRICAGCEYQRP